MLSSFSELSLLFVYKKYNENMRPGPKFEITRDMALENILTVAKRLGVSVLSYRDYQANGSFSARAITRKWSWVKLCQLAGIQPGINGRPRRGVVSCLQCGKTSSRHHCKVCRRRINRLAMGGL